MSKPSFGTHLTLLAASLALWLSSAPPLAAAPPDEGDCPTVSGSGGAGGSPAVDAVPITLREGMVLTADHLLILRQLVPREIWSFRGTFFFEGMRMELGPCHRRYPVNGFFREATAALSPAVGLDKKGNLTNYRAGLPFPPAAIDPESDDAALRWAWNLALRYRGAGPHGGFSIVDFPSEVGGIQTYQGSYYLLLTHGRGDLAGPDYRLPAGKRLLWAAGGTFTRPLSARHLRWRQFRTTSSLRDYRSTDDVFIYVPTMRKVRRASAAWADGLYVPRFTATEEGGGGAMPMGEFTINPNAGSSIAVSENIRKGFEGLALRPNAYVWRMLGEQDVLAPLNGARTGWPQSENRNYGPSGLSVASDRWEVRRAVLIEGAARRSSEAIKTVTYYVDYQTQQPLYRLTRLGRRALADVQIFVHRFSGDVADYPNWNERGTSFVFDPVAQVSFNALAGRGGWRRESYDSLSTPYDPDKIRRLTSSTSLARGH